MNASIRVSRRSAERGTRWSRAALRSSSCAGGLFALSLLSQAMAQALPGTATIVSGQADIARTANSVTLTQGTQRLITNWTDFNVGAGNTVRFVQPNVDAVALNRVTGTTLSTIAGTITGNGRVFLVNPNGVLMSGTANVSLGSLVVSTRAIDNDQFLGGNYRFTGSSTARVINQGSIAANTPRNDAYVALIGSDVSNEGVLDAGSGGRIALVAGDQVRIAPERRDWVTASETTPDAAITNSGSLFGQGGEVVLLLKGTNGSAGINQSGIIRADSLIDGAGGRIVLDAGTQRVTTTGLMNASGRSQGGRVEVQGGTVQMGSTIQANAEEGSGGQIQIQSSGDLAVNGAISLEGTGGSGGAALLRSGGALQIGASVDVSGSAQGGSIEIDGATSLTWGAGAALRATGEGAGAGAGAGAIRLTAPSFTVGSSGGINQMPVADLLVWLNEHRSTVDLRAAQDLTLASNLASDAAGGRLSLTAGRSVLINSTFRTGTTPLTLVANAKDVDLQAGRGTGQGAIRMAANASLVTGGNVSLKVGGVAGDANAGEMVLTTVRAGALSIESPLFAGTATASNKVYDGTSSAPLQSATVTGLDLSGSNLELATSGSFADKGVGTGKEVRVRYAVSGFDTAEPGRQADLLRQGVALTATSTADITPRTLRVSQLTGTSKVYDGLTTATAQIGADDRVQGDQLTLAATGSFADKNVGTGKQITIQSVRLEGADAANYTADTSGLTAQADITRRRLNLVGAFAEDKIYDGTTAATVGFVRDDRVAGDVVEAEAKGTFSSKDVGVNKRVQVGTVALTGTDARNYEATTSEIFTAADITRRTLTLSELTGQTKVYDGTRAATVSYGGNNRLSGDELSVNVTAQFDSAHAGTGKLVTVTQLDLSGADAGNYRIDDAPRTTTAEITRRQLVVSNLAGQNKVYDGTRVAQVQIGSDDRVAGDDLQFSTTASFDSKQAGIGKRVTVDDIRLSGANAGDYLVQKAGLFTTATIDRRVLSLAGLSAQDKLYDGNAVAEVRYARNDRVAGDQVQVSAVGSFSNKQAGTNKLVTVNGVTLSGIDADNYVVEVSGDTTRATIDPRLLTLGGLTASDKVYDGNRVAQTRYATDDRVAGDELQIHTTASFDDKYAGTGKTVTVNQIGLTGADAANYRLEGAGATTTAAIDQRLLTLSQLAALDKIYDQTVRADVSAGGDDRVRGDQLTVALTGEFDTRHVGRDKTVTVTGIRLSGDDASNYRVTEDPLTTQAAVTPRTLKVGVTAADKVYDGKRDASVAFGDDRLAGDHLQLVDGTHRFADANAGKDKTVTSAGWQLIGDDAGNYRLDAPSWQTSAHILPRVLHVTAPSSVEFSKSLRPQTLPIGHDALGIDPIQVVAGSLRWGPAEGLPRAATLADLAIQGPGAGNYVLDVPTLTTLAIVKAPLPLPSTSGEWLCSGPGRGCGAVLDARLGTAGALPGQTSEAGTKPSTPALVVRQRGIQVPTQHLMEDGE
ncbi:YDG domain-containing protein [Roseateles terrae]|uniref:Filamentous hemagglutinin family protein n=1 Tax=Roseateles terrae TaxID=431060 RepID=A0ABR6GPH2_9BURK|nr:YDG domain-containing protein [Roseateles terrae]MBB3193998.1 filamentous hemagglutinin family protein [Roseateles terrae]